MEYTVSLFRRKILVLVLIIIILVVTFRILRHTQTCRFYKKNKLITQRHSFIDDLNFEVAGGLKEKSLLKRDVVKDFAIKLNRTENDYFLLETNYDHRVSQTINDFKNVEKIKAGKNISLKDVIKSVQEKSVKAEKLSDGELLDGKEKNDNKADTEIDGRFSEMINRSRNFELQRNLVPNSVYFVWCKKDDNNYFQFNHYLSVKSAWAFLRPDVIEIYYDHLPKQNMYDSWLDELNDTIPALFLSQLNSDMISQCAKGFGLDVLFDRGGIYITWDTIITSTVSQYRAFDFMVVFDSQGKIKIVVSKQGHTAVTELKYSKNNVSISNSLEICETVQNVNFSMERKLNCFVLTESIRPTDIMSVRSDVGNVLRFVYYGVAHPVQTRVDKTTSIPKIIHYVLYGKTEMTYMMYLSLLSSLYIVKADRAYIHGDHTPEGSYWDKIKSHPNLRVIYREPPTQIFGQDIKYSFHRTDVTMNQILLKYGGIYVGWDVIWLRPVDDLLTSGYDVVVSFDNAVVDNFAATVNMEVVLAKPEAEFLKALQDSYKYYQDKDIDYGSAKMPYKLFEKYPWLVHVDSRLQVICVGPHCHPSHPLNSNTTSDDPYDWTEDSYAVHFLFPEPQIFLSEQLLVSGQGRLAEIGKNVLKAAEDEMLEETRRLSESVRNQEVFSM